MNSRNKALTGGFSLLELVVTTAMMATLVVSCMGIVRTSYTAWRRHEDDHSQRSSGLAVLKHIVRSTRQARAVVAISQATENSGNLSLLAADGSVLVWEHNSSTNEVLFGVGTATDVLATGIEELTFVGIDVDGTTTTAEPESIHSIVCTAKVNLARPAGTETVTTSNQAWLRSW